MIRTLMMACVIPGLLLAGCGSVNTYRATAGEKAGKTAYEAQINDALTSIFWLLSSDEAQHSRVIWQPSLISQCSYGY